MTPITDAARARNLARAVVSDILAYHDEKVRQGIQNDDLFERLAPEIEAARVYFESRVAEQLQDKSNLWGRALVDVLVARSAHVASRIW